MSSWAKMADDLDRNRKIRKGGRNAREVFLWVLRKVASGNTSGWVKAEDFDDLEWLADELMTPLTELTDGVSRCFAVGLLERDGDRVRVVGWDGHWAIRKPMSGAERQAKSAAKKRSGDSGRLQDSTDALLTELLTENVSDRQQVTAVTKADATDVVEESREEKKRERSDAREERPGQTTAKRSVALSQRLGVIAKAIWFEHCDRYDAVKPAGAPGLLRLDTATGCTNLRDRLRMYGADLDKAEADCRHVLAVLEAEARANVAKGAENPMQWFGDRAWTAGTFSGALSKSAPSVALGGSSPAKRRTLTAENMFGDPS